jgi:JAB1/Mov34/MPN/PAD-1 ubiquitin protease
MSLTTVKMTEEVWLTCVAHSLTTESEEIMGVLLGDIQVYSPSLLPVLHLLSLAS